MSRLYRIEIGAETAAPVGNPNSAPSGNAGAVFTNQINGKPDPGALQVELDIPVTAFATPFGAGYVKVWGVSIAQVEQAADFNGAPITVTGGMQKGLPLATAAAGQSGVLVKGVILQAYGNWMGVNQTLDLVISTDGGATQNDPASLSFLWKKGSELKDMIQQTLSKAYPKLKLDISISSGLTLPADEPGYYSTIQQFCTWLKSVSQEIKGGKYPGVDVTLSGDTLRVYDGSSAADPVLIAFQDLIGQPTWIDAFTVQFSTVMRADLKVGSVIKFPPASQFLTVTTQNSQSQARSKSTFSGTWTVANVRHVGNSRSDSAQGWMSTFRAYANDAPQSATNPTGNSSS